MMLALLIGAWCGARVMWWEDPFVAAGGARAADQPPVAAKPLEIPAATASFARYVPLPDPAAAWVAPATDPGGKGAGARVWRAAERVTARPVPWNGSLPGVLPGPSLPPGGGAGMGRDAPDAPQSATQPPFLAPARAVPVAAPPGRWSLDGWAFWRQGPSAVPASQGRVPVYGASQAGAVLQYRLAPARGHDPRLYARAYRALVQQGESELALGGSLRPLARVPLRVAGEVRYTDAVLSRTFRPAAYAVTEIPPLRLPIGAQAEVYGQAGWVGGAGETPFADAQASVTRSLPWAARLTDERLRMSVGAGAWGGAQKGAQRLDLGPTLRLDTRIGQVPARIAVDWRLRVAGDAIPGSGVAVTVATGF